MHQLNISTWRRWTLRHGIRFDRMPPRPSSSSTSALRCRTDRFEQFLTVVSPTSR